MFQSLLPAHVPEDIHGGASGLFFTPTRAIDHHSRDRGSLHCIVSRVQAAAPI